MDEFNENQRNIKPSCGITELQIISLYTGI